jgi:hypothetical protein
MNVLASIRGADTAPCPGWLVHDGRTMPVAPASQPGVAFRNGWRVSPAQYTAAHWIECGRDFWRHLGGPLDIVAYLPSYRPPPAARWRAALCNLIGERLGGDAGDGISERLADDIIALLGARTGCDTFDPRLELPGVFACDK